jgi:hypothetical protein
MGERRIYGHLVPGANRQAVDNLDDASICNQTQPEKQKWFSTGRLRSRHFRTVLVVVNS